MEKNRKFISPRTQIPNVTTSEHTVSYEEFILNKRKITVPTPFIFQSNIRSTRHTAKNHSGKTYQKHSLSPNPVKLKINPSRNYEIEGPLFSTHFSPNLRIKSPSKPIFKNSNFKKEPSPEKKILNEAKVKKVHFEIIEPTKELLNVKLNKHTFESIKNSFRKTPPLFLVKEEKKSPQNTISNVFDIDKKL